MRSGRITVARHRPHFRSPSPRYYPTTHQVKLVQTVADQINDPVEQHDFLLTVDSLLARGNVIPSNEAVQSAITSALAHADVAQPAHYKLGQIYDPGEHYRWWRWTIEEANGQQRNLGPYRTFLEALAAKLADQGGSPP